MFIFEISSHGTHLIFKEISDSNICKNFSSTYKMSSSKGSIY
jgi:hypothetical protein